MKQARAEKTNGRTDASSSALAGVSREALLSIYRGMVRIRLLDERMMLHQRQGRIGFYGACTGQEATPVATAEALEPTDWVFPGLREGSIMLQRGYPLVDYLGQVFGNAGDPCKGRQMPSHQADRRVNQVSWSSVIGTQWTHAVGAAMAAKYKGDRTVIVGFIGDGGTSSAEFHQGMNFAGVFKPPVVLICQNNQWAISVPAAKQTASETIAIKAKAYGFEGVRVDGNDAVDVYRTVRAAVEKARKGGGPTFIEALTYRIGAHSSSDDPSRYRDPREVEEWVRRDPIESLQRRLFDAGILDEAADRRMRDSLSAEIAAAVAEAEALPPPALATMFEDVYSTELPHLREEREEYERWLAHDGITKPRGHGVVE